MGTLSRIWSTKRGRFSQKGAGKRQYPLKKIVGSDGQYEILECGHRGAFHLSVGTNLFSGYQPAASRRCRQCFKNTHNPQTPNQ